MKRKAKIKFLKRKLKAAKQYNNALLATISDAASSQPEPTGMYPGKCECEGGPKGRWENNGLPHCGVCERVYPADFIGAISGMQKIVNKVPGAAVAAQMVEYAGMYPGTSFCLCWGEPGVGFGEVMFQIKEGTDDVVMYTESMNKQFVKKMLCRMVDTAEILD